MVRTLCLSLFAAFVCLAQTPDRVRGVRPPQNQRPDTGRRMALVIGNSKYPDSPLQNPANDARDLGAVLTQLGFTAVVKYDLNEDSLDRAVADFAAQVRPGDVALFYYAGHGMQIDGENLLLPVDFKLKQDAISAKRHSFHVNDAVDRLRTSRARTIILILDACRDNPYQTSRSFGGSRGLAGMNGEGVYFAFAAAEGKTAEDNPQDRNGLFTKHLLAGLREPGLGIDEVFTRVRSGVYQDSHQRQLPFSNSGLTQPFVFREAVRTAAATVDLDLERYNAVRDSRDPAQLEAMAAKLKRDDLADLLRERARALRSVTKTASAAPPAKSDSSEPLRRAEAAYGRGDFDTARSLYRPLAEAGNLQAMRRLGFIYEKGLATPQDHSQAAFWYGKAADAGDRYGLYHVASMYESGDGVAQDYGKAALFYRRAADAGESDAMYRLGSMYENGRGQKKDRDTAISWYRKAAQAGNEDAKTHLNRLGVNP